MCTSSVTAASRAIAAWAIVLFLAVTAHAAGYAFRHLTRANGLPSNGMRRIMQDSRGFLWFGTTGGLARYDGRAFTTYVPRQGDTTSLPGYFVFRICEDSTHMLWLGMASDGLCRMDPVTGTITRIRIPDTTSKSLTANVVNMLYTTRDGTVWIGTLEAGMYSYQPATGAWTTYKHTSDASSLPENKVFELYEDRRGTLWVSTVQRISVLDRTTGKFTVLAPLGQPYMGGGFSETKSGDLIVGLRFAGLCRFDRSTNAFVSLWTDSLFNAYRVFCTCEQPDGTIWMGSTGGACVWDPRTSIGTVLPTGEGDPDLIPDNTLQAMCMDRSGAVWIGTNSGGISVWDPAEHKAGVIGARLDRYPFLPSRKVTTMLITRDGTRWYATLTALVESNPNTGMLRAYGKTAETSDHLRRAGGLLSSTVTALAEDSAGNLWIGSSQGLNRLDRKRHRIDSWTLDTVSQRSLGGNFVNVIHVDPQGVVWVVTGGGGLDRYDPATNDFTRFLLDTVHKTGVNRNTFVSLTVDDKGIFWMGTNHEGLVHFDPRTGAIGAFTHADSDEHSLNDPMPQCVAQSSDGLYCVGFMDRGIALFDPATGRCDRLTQRDGLPTDAVRGMLADRSGSIWITTTKGITRFDPRSRTFHTFTPEDGLPGNEFALRAAYLAPDGTLYFGGYDGVAHIDPAKLTRDTSAPRPIITSLDYLGRSIPIGTAADPMRGATVAYRDNVLHVTFTALDCAQPQRCRIIYKLEGFDHDWIDAAGRTDATYTNLDPGTYTLRVKACSHDGVWNATDAALPLVVTPPWYRSSMAYGAYAALAIIALLTARRYDRNRIRLQEQVRSERDHASRLAELDRAKSRFFANISHEFRTPLTLLLAPLERMIAVSEEGQERERLHLMRRNARRLLTLINQLLDLSRADGGTLAADRRAIDAGALLRGIAASFQSLGESRDIRFTADLPGDPGPVMLDADKTEKIVTNLLSNAFKFTPAGGAVALGARIERGLLEIRVADTGIGIAADELPRVFDRFYQVDSSATRGFEGAGIGLALTREFVEVLGGSIGVESTPGAGTTFTVNIPVVPADALLIAEEAESHQDSSDRAVAPQDAERNQATDLPMLLIAEDNADLRAVLAEQFRDDCRVVFAENGAVALDKALKEIPDIIVSDVMMPGMDGFVLAERIKTDERTSHVPVILLTARAGRECKIAGLQTGADDYLVKPFDAEELRTRVMNLIESRRVLRERFRDKLIVAATPVEGVSMDEAFVRRVREVIENNMGDESFTVEGLAQEVGMSRVHLHRKLTALTGKSAGQLISAIRLQRARQLLEQRTATVSEIAYQVGFGSPSYFAKCFKDAFGYPPSAGPGQQG